MESTLSFRQERGEGSIPTIQTMKLDGRWIYVPVKECQTSCGATISSIVTYNSRHHQADDGILPSIFSKSNHERRWWLLTIILLKSNWIRTTVTLSRPSYQNLDDLVKMTDFDDETNLQPLQALPPTPPLRNRRHQSLPPYECCRPR